MVCNQAGQIGSDTLAVLKDVYLNYRTARDPDGLSEDIVLAIVPGVMQDKPTNEYLDAAWKSLKALGSRHVGPKIGRIVLNKQLVVVAACVHPGHLEPNPGPQHGLHLPDSAEGIDRSEAHEISDRSRRRACRHCLQLVASADGTLCQHAEDDNAGTR